MPTVIEATYRVTTPMFCGGANPADAELRLPSFKGALRFWWRALAWPQPGLKGDLKAIKREEDELFGSADKGQSRVSMRLTDYVKPQTGAGYSLGAGQGARYLGYGVMERGTKNERDCLEAPFKFSVRMRARELDATQRRSLLDALTALGVFGGMGAKSRKGYGSLALQSLKVDGVEQWQAPRSIGELQSVIGSLRVHDSTDDVPYTAISKRSRCLLLEIDNRSSRGRRQSSRSGRRAGMDLLDRIGVELKDAVTDVKGIQRIAFGLPRASRAASIPNVERRASPLFIHIHECGSAPVAVLSFLPARFLPMGKASIPDEDTLYNPIHTFLDKLTSRRDGIRVVEVRP